MAWLWLKFFLFKAWRNHLISFRTCAFWNPHLTNPSKQKAVRTVAQQLDRFSSLRVAFTFSSPYRVSRSFLSTAFSQTSPIRTSSERGGNSTWEFSPTVCLLHVLSEWINSPIKAQGSPDPIKTTNGTIRPIKHHNLFQKRVPSSESIMSSKPGGKQNGINDLRWNKKEQVSLPGSMMHTGKNREKTSNTTRKPDSGCHVKSIFMQGCSLRSFFERDRF